VVLPDDDAPRKASAEGVAGWGWSGTALEKYVVASARPGDVDDAIRVIDHFCRQVSYLINVGDEKGKILDSAVERTQPRRLLELGTYCGYSARCGWLGQCRARRGSTQLSSTPRMR
jgi:hypothetical protein